MTTDEYVDLVYANIKDINFSKKYPCVSPNVTESVAQDEFYDMRFCGTRGGKAFLNATRPTANSDGSWSCPTGTSACSKATSPEYTICQADMSLCPITFMQFVPVNATASLDPAVYQVMAVNSDYSFVTSKTVGDNLPLASFRVESEPCLDPTETSVGFQQKFYPFEADNITMTGCSVVEQYNKQYDPRFIDLKLTITEKAVQTESKVIDKLMTQPGYDAKVFETSKSSTVYSFWTRPTATWSLACESLNSKATILDGVSKQGSLEAIDVTRLSRVNYSAWGIGLTGALIMFGCYMGQSSGVNDTSRVLCSCCILTVQLILFIVAVVKLSGYKEDLSLREEMLVQVS